MPETTSDRTIFTLSEIARGIQKTISEKYTGTFWIKAEMNRLNHYPQSGHCYPDLVEKADDKIVAEFRSTIWKEDFIRISRNFQSVLHEPLKNGIKILFCARIVFSPVYGLSLSILDIDPSYSLGELEKEKIQTIERLRKEGIFDANRSHRIALLPKRIAIISVRTSKGFSDFCKVLAENEWGYRFFLMMFPSVLQGDQAAGSILGQLRKIKRVRHHFDAVAIIRGGGGDIGLMCYNNYELSREIALFPIPVLTGIGHSTNETVAEMVAFRNAITPTDLADYLLQQFHNFSVPLREARVSIVNRCRSRLKEEKMRMGHEVRGLAKSVQFLFAGHRQQADRAGQTIRKDAVHLLSRAGWMVSQQIPLVAGAAERLLTASGERLHAAGHALSASAEGFLLHEKESVEALGKRVELVDPVNVLKRGYSLTLVDGRAVKSVEQAGEGKILTTVVADGKIMSVIKTTEKNKP